MINHEFTDDNLKQAKAFAEFSNKTPVDLVGLIARLEAAELFINVGSAHPTSKKYYEAWRKAAGL